MYLFVCFQLNDHCDRMQMEKEAHKEHIGKLNEKIEHANIENQKVCGGDRLGL